MDPCLNFMIAFLVELSLIAYLLTLSSLPFNGSLKGKKESVNKYPMRLRTLAKHCNFGGHVRKIIGATIGTMLEIERECIHTDNLTLGLVLSTGYEKF